MKKLSPIWDNRILIIVAFGILAGIFLQGIQLGMKKGMISQRYQLYAIPIAISQLLYDAPRNYTGYEAVGTLFLEKGLVALEGEALHLKAFDKKALWFWDTDDKGLVDFVYFAFAIFGVKSSSLYYMFFLIMLFTVGVYCVQFYGNRNALFVLVCFLLSLYTTLFVMPLNDQWGNIIEPRFMPVLSMIPMFHIVMFCTDRKTSDKRYLPLVAIQILVFCIVFNFRSSGMWQIVFLLLVGGTLFFANRKAARKLNIYPWIITLLFIGTGILGVGVYKNTFYHDRYKQYSGSQHVIWHNMYMGYALHPKLSVVLNSPSVDDRFVVLQVKKYLLDTGQQDRWMRIEADNKQHSTSILGVNNWNEYERACRSAYFDVWHRYPREVFETFVFYKPVFFVSQFLWAAGLVAKDYKYVGIPESHQVADKDGRVRKSLFYNPFRLSSLTLLIILVLWMVWRHTMLDTKTIIILAVGAWLCSLIPGFLTYPLFWVIGEAFVTTTILLYVAISAFLFALAKNSFGRKGRK